MIAPDLASARLRVAILDHGSDGVADELRVLLRDVRAVEIISAVPPDEAHRTPDVVVIALGAAVELGMAMMTARRTVPDAATVVIVPWFEESLELSERAAVTLDLNPAGVSTLRRKGIDARQLPLGYVPELSHGKGIDIGLGTQFTINDRPDSLDRYYGDDLGYAFQFFLRIRPSLHSHAANEHAEHVAGMEK